MGTAPGDVRNSFNIYKIITEADSPVSLLSALSDRVNPLRSNDIAESQKKDYPGEPDDDGIYPNYLYYFKKQNFLESENEN
jgi:hypothetical protein